MALATEGARLDNRGEISKLIALSDMEVRYGSQYAPGHQVAESDEGAVASGFAPVP